VLADRAKRNWPSSPFVLWKDIRQQSSGRDKQKTQRESLAIDKQEYPCNLSWARAVRNMQHAGARMSSSHPADRDLHLPADSRISLRANLVLSWPSVYPFPACFSPELQLSRMLLKLLINFWNGWNSVSRFLFSWPHLLSCFHFCFLHFFFFAQPFGVLCHVWFFCVWFSSAVLKFEHLYSGHCQVPSRGLFETAVFVTLVVVMYRMFNMSTFIYLCLGHLYPLFQMDLAESTPPFWPKAIGHHIACIWLTKRTLYNRKFF